MSHGHSQASPGRSALILTRDAPGHAGCLLARAGPGPWGSFPPGKNRSRLEQPTRNRLKVYQWFSAKGKCPGVKPSCISQLEVMVATGI